MPVNWFVSLIRALSLVGDYGSVVMNDWLVIGLLMLILGPMLFDLIMLLLDKLID